MIGQKIRWKRPYAVIVTEYGLCVNGCGHTAMCGLTIETLMKGKQQLLNLYGFGEMTVHSNLQ